MNIQINLAKTADIPQLGQLASRTFVTTYKDKTDRSRAMVADYVKETFSHEQLAKDFSDPRVNYYLGYKGETLIGYGKLIQKDPPDFVKKKKCILLERIYLDSQYQGSGFGGLFLKFLEEAVQKKSYPGIWLSVWEENKQAIRFYLRQGYEKVGSQKWKFKYADVDYEDLDYVFMKILD